jgi:hypothetical protein
MYTPMTQKEFKQLRKLANQAKKQVKQIDECGEFATTQEYYSLRELQETATSMLNLVNSMLYR